MFKKIVIRCEKSMVKKIRTCRMRYATTAKSIYKLWVCVCAELHTAVNQSVTWTMAIVKTPSCLHSQYHHPASFSRKFPANRWHMKIYLCISLEFSERWKNPVLTHFQYFIMRKWVNLLAQNVLMGANNAHTISNSHIQLFIIQFTILRFIINRQTSKINNQGMMNSSSAVFPHHFVIPLVISIEPIVW